MKKRSKGPRERYERDLQDANLIADAAQARAIAHLDRLYYDLRDFDAQARPGLIDRLLRRTLSTATVRGLYLWGRVGRGKTYLVDTFYDCIGDTRKLRIHFHSFMRKIHMELKARGHGDDPLQHIASAWASEFRLLCLDEFHVGDITDAMILGKLLQSLHGRGVTLVATSNEAPHMLYRDGLQRERFLPAIDFLETHLDVVELDGELDYRLRALEQAEVYYVPHSAATEEQMHARFVDIAPEPGLIDAVIEINGREIATCRHADGVVWFDFATLCDSPRSTEDYIELALCHHTIVLSDIPVMGAEASDAARRFINLVDELYDRNVKLLVSAAAFPEQLYAGQRLREPFARTVSRLREMQSHDYLVRPHLCD